MSRRKLPGRSGTLIKTHEEGDGSEQDMAATAPPPRPDRRPTVRLPSLRWPGGQLVHVLAFAMVLYAAAVDGGCRTLLRLVGPLEVEGAGPCANDVTDADTWPLLVRQWRQRSSGRRLDVDGAGLI